MRTRREGFILPTRPTLPPALLPTLLLALALPALLLSTGGCGGGDGWGFPDVSEEEYPSAPTFRAGDRRLPDEPADLGDVPEPIERDLPEIEKRGELTMLTMTNATSYFIYRGELLGFEFGLLWRFARDHDLALEVEVVDDRFELLRRLNSGDGDVIASQLTAPSRIAEHVAYTEPLYQSRPALVQPVEKPRDADMAEPVERLLLDDPDAFEDRIEVGARLIRRPSELAGAEIHVPAGTATVDRLIELEDRISGDIHIVEVAGEASYEELIRRVAEGEIDLTAAPEVIARLDQAYFTNIVVRPQLREPVDVVWGVRKNAPELRAELDRWLARQQRTARWNELIQRYFSDRRGYRERRVSRYLTSMTSELSPYDALIKQYAPRVGWDWRLLAAQVFQESKFDPRATSWAGARGLLQLMPPTARQFGVRNSFDPEDNVRGGTAYLEWLGNYWADKIPDENERLRFILASYNAGQGHLQDARRLTAKYGDDPSSWEDVSYWLMQKSKRRYYTDPVVYFGFVRGLEPVSYVRLILERYRHYLRFVEA